MSTALLVIDIQNDYFTGGKFPLWNAEAVLGQVEHAIARAREYGIRVIHVQHVMKQSPAPFFAMGTPGAEIHPRILAAAPDAPVIVKEHADSFEKTTLDATLSELGVKNLLICGMMTQNCVAYTAVSKAAEKYNVTILPDCCTTVDAMIHAFAINALSDRLKVAPWKEAV